MDKIWKKPIGLIRRITGKHQSPDKGIPSILNEAINFEKKIIFIAIPKTGTTTVRNQVREKGVPLIPNPHLNIIQVRDALYIHLLKNALGRNTNFPTQSVPADLDLRARAKYVFDTFFKFSAVRNPWARAVSLYFRQEGVQVRDRISFEAFCDKHLYASDTCCQPTLHKNQIDWLCDENGRNIMDYVYKLEDFAMAVKEINERTGGRLQIAHKVENKNPVSLSHSYRELYSDKTKRIIGERFQKDIDCFKYTF